MMIGTYTSLFDSPLTPWTTLGPLSVVLMFSMIKEGLEDFKRHSSDRQINNSMTFVMDVNHVDDGDTPKFIATKWKNVKVGDLVKVDNNKDIPADLVLLYSTEENSSAFIETANIDGETNLKIRNAANTGSGNIPGFDNIMSFANIDTASEITYEIPNANIHTFTGTLQMLNSKTPIDQQHILLRGATIRNTGFIIGACIYTGRDTKVIRNSRESR